MTTPYIQANTNGRLHAAHEPSLSPLNRGFLYGDAVYEVWRSYNGVLFAWDEHWARCRRSAEALHFERIFGPEELWPEIERTVAAYRQATGSAGEIYVRLQISRGGGAIGLDPQLADQPDFVLLVQALPQVSPAQQRQGLRLATARDLRRNPIASLSPAWKTGNYLNNILCLREARARGADEVVMLNLEGELTEAAVSNLAFVREGVVVTPPVSVGILEGITRALLIGEVAPQAGFTVREEVVRPADLAHMQECFLLSTTKDVAPVASIDDQAFTVGESTVGARLKQAFADYMAAYAAAHPERRVAV